MRTVIGDMKLLLTCCLYRDTVTNRSLPRGFPCQDLSPLRKGSTVPVRKFKVKWWDAFKKEPQCSLPAVEGWFKSNRLLPSSHQSQQSQFLAQRAKTTALLASAQTHEEYLQILQSLTPKRDDESVSSNFSPTGSVSSISPVISLGNDNEDDCFGILPPVKH